MKFTVCMGGAVAAGFILCGCATSTSNPKQPASAAVVSDPNCLTETGSRISAGKSNCRGFGRSYTNDDISRTGQTSAADALVLLDPSITVHR